MRLVEVDSSNSGDCFGEIYKLRRELNELRECVDADARKRVCNFAFEVIFIAFAFETENNCFDEMNSWLEVGHNIYMILHLATDFVIRSHTARIECIPIVCVSFCSAIHSKEASIQMFNDKMLTQCKQIAQLFAWVRA